MSNPASNPASTPAPAPTPTPAQAAAPAAQATHQGARLILRADDGLVVLYKPCGMPTHATERRDGQDLMSVAMRELGLPHGLSPIHRLDVDTSGLVLASADARTRRDYGYLFSQRQTTKRYLALVHGHTHRKGIIRKPLEDERRGAPLDAITRYRSLERFLGCTLIEARPETGRKHQLRRHLQGVGHAIVGDARYRPKQLRPIPAFPGRLWLHALALELDDGRRWECPLPLELQHHLDQLRASQPARAARHEDDAAPEP